MKNIFLRVQQYSLSQFRGDLFVGEDGIQVDYHKAVQLALAYLRETTPSRRRGEPPATP
jgi:hypothetical protein